MLGLAKRLGLAIVLAAIWAAPASALAAGGIPDASFGAGGLASVNASFPGAREFGNAMVLDAQDRVLVGGGVLEKPPEELNGGWVLARFRSDGSPDPTFGEGGVSREAPGLFGSGLGEYGQAIRALAIEPETGKIIAGGMTVTPAHYPLFTIARYDTDGALDMTFGPANTGFVTTEITPSGSELNDIAVSADGHITAVGSSGLGVALARWDSDGNLDPEFDGPAGTGNGAFSELIAGTIDDFRDVAIEPSGAVRAVGIAVTGGNAEWLVVRYTPTGARDLAFNGTGALTIGFGNGFDSADCQVLDGGVLHVFGTIDVEPGKTIETDIGVVGFNVSTGAVIPGTTAKIPIPGSQGVFDCALQQPGGTQGPSADRFLISGLGETPGGGGPLLVAMRRAAPGSPVLEPDPEFGSGGFVEPSRRQGNWANVSTDSQNRVVVGGELGLYETADLSAGRYIDVPASPPPGADTTAPVISGAKVTPRSWAVRDGGRAETPVASRVKQGTSFRYTLSEAARVTIRIERRKRRKGGKRAKFTRVGTFAKSGAAGANRNPFSGRIGKKRLRPGRYRATLVATDAAGNPSAPRQVVFKVILRPIPRSAGAT
jgi:uncharacterized delta-60 repeat protein